MTIVFVLFGWNYDEPERILDIYKTLPELPRNSSLWTFPNGSSDVFDYYKVEPWEVK